MIFFPTIFYYLIITVSILLTSFFSSNYQKENNSVWKVSQETNFSSSYIYKRLNNINKLFGLYGISVHFSLRE